MSGRREEGVPGGGKQPRRRGGDSRGGDPARKRRGGGAGRSRAGGTGAGGHRDDRDGGRRRTWDVSAGTLPHWVSEDLARVTPRAKLGAAIEKLTQAAEAFAAGKHGRSLRLAEQAKELSPRDATVRELLGLSAYRIGKWDVALRELRTYRRYTGDMTHLAVEMDVLRALDRPDDVHGAWELMQQRGGSRDARNEAKVVYAAFLLDQDEPRRAWDIAAPGRISGDAVESDLRVWYVAARAAARLGDKKTARRLYEAILDIDPSFPALDELDLATGGG